MKGLREGEFHATNAVLSCVAVPSSGPPLLLLHGLCDRWQVFLPLMSRLSDRFEVHAFDMRGHGRSGRVPGEYRPGDYYRDAAEFLRSRFDGPVVIFGHSAGGLIALW